MWGEASTKRGKSLLFRNFYYNVKPLIPRYLQILLRRQLVKRKRRLNGHIWPIDPNAGNPPENWPGWPEGKQFCLVLSHDVETQAGHDKCLKLMALEKEMGFRSSFNFVPERYRVSEEVRREIVSKGFEVCVHGLKHDGKLFLTEEIFRRRVIRINQYIREWGAQGFTSPAMHHNLDWMHELAIKHDTSTFDTDPFEPQPDAVGTIFPIWIRNHKTHEGFAELPYTLPQDHTLFVILQEQNNDLWKQKLNWIATKGGMVLLNSHPDYMQFEGEKTHTEMYPSELYIDFIKYVHKRYVGRYWHALPMEVANFLCNSNANRTFSKNGRR